jgi:hypothetical protein
MQIKDVLAFDLSDDVAASTATTRPATLAAPAAEDEGPKSGANICTPIRRGCPAESVEEDRQEAPAAASIEAPA